MIIIDYGQQRNISISLPYNSRKGNFDTTLGFQEFALLPLIRGIVSNLCVSVCVCVCVCILARGRFGSTSVSKVMRLSV